MKCSVETNSPKPSHVQSDPERSSTSKFQPWVYQPLGDQGALPSLMNNPVLKQYSKISIISVTYQSVVFQITYFGLAGGMTTKETVWRTLTQLLTNAMNWRGANGKEAFEPLALVALFLSQGMGLSLWV